LELALTGPPYEIPVMLYVFFFTSTSAAYVNGKIAKSNVKPLGDELPKKHLMLIISSASC
jgi:hypothetical protein